jgi:hypothetical protein
MSVRKSARPSRRSPRPSIHPLCHRSRGVCIPVVHVQHVYHTVIPPLNLFSYHVAQPVDVLCVVLVRCCHSLLCTPIAPISSTTYPRSQPCRRPEVIDRMKARSADDKAQLKTLKKQVRDMEMCVPEDRPPRHVSHRHRHVPRLPSLGRLMHAWLFVSSSSHPT